MASTASTRPRFRTANSNGRRRPLVGLTPLIDVVFILLLFFMLASSFLDVRAIPLDAPARTGGAPSMQGALLVDLRSDGVRYGGAYMSLDRLAERVGAQLERKPDRRVLVKPSSGVSLQETVTVLDRLSGVGARNLSLIGDPSPSGDS